MSRRKYYKHEKMLKGVANHRRLEMLDQLNRNPGLSNEEINERLKINYQTGSEHIRRLVIAGLIQKHREGHKTLHTLTKTGVEVIKFLEKQ